MPEVKVPELAESITEGTIAEWLKNVGDSVEKGEAILELETDKVNVEVVSKEEGVLQEQLASEGDTVEVGQVIATVGEGSGNASSSKEESSDQSQSMNNDEATKELAQPTESQSNNEETQSNPNNQRVNATPSARRHARENGVDLSTVSEKETMLYVKMMLKIVKSKSISIFSRNKQKEEPKNLQVHLINL